MHNFKSVIRSLEQKDEREYWNYITGLRGPDTEDGAGILKAFTTCVIRGDTKGAGGSWGIEKVFEKSWDMKSFDRAVGMVSYHWFQHHRSALLALSYYFKEKKDFARAEIILEMRTCFSYSDNLKYTSLAKKFVRMG